MCIELPSRVVSVDEDGATVDLEGRRRRASTLLVPDVAPGDWVYLAVGTIIRRLEPAEAELIRSTLTAAMAADEAGTSQPVQQTGGTA
jgi:hydrogenase assembly chaperone HypC/HupF